MSNADSLFFNSQNVDKNNNNSLLGASFASLFYRLNDDCSQVNNASSSTSNNNNSLSPFFGICCSYCSRLSSDNINSNIITLDCKLHKICCTCYISAINSAAQRGKASKTNTESGFININEGIESSSVSSSSDENNFNERMSQSIALKCKLCCTNNNMDISSNCCLESSLNQQFSLVNNSGVDESNNQQKLEAANSVTDVLKHLSLDDNEKFGLLSSNQAANTNTNNSFNLKDQELHSLLNNNENSSDLKSSITNLIQPIGTQISKEPAVAIVNSNNNNGNNNTNGNCNGALLKNFSDYLSLLQQQQKQQLLFAGMNSINVHSMSSTKESITTIQQQQQQQLYQNWLLNKSCLSCQEKPEADSICYCLDCKERLCQNCYLAHKRVKMTKDHRIHFYFTCPDATVTSNLPEEAEAINLQPNLLSCSSSASTPPLDSGISSSSSSYSTTSATSGFKNVSYIYGNNSGLNIGVGAGVNNSSNQMSACIASNLPDALNIKSAELDQRKKDLIENLEKVKNLKVASLGKQIDEIKNLSNIISVLINSSHIHNSPFTVQVKSSRSYSNVGKVVFCINGGGEGSGDGQFCRPWGVCCDTQGNIIIADRSNNRIQVFDHSGKFVRKFGSYGTRAGQFDRPAGVAFDNQLNRIVVTDKDNHRIQVFHPDGTFIFKFGEKGSKPGHYFNYPWDVAVSSESNILISDTRNHRIQLFNSNGIFLNKYGFDGPLWKQFDSPRGVCFNQQNQIIVTDFNNHRLLVINPDFQTAKFLGSEGSGNGQFLRPQGCAVDHEGNIIVADSRNYRVQIFTPNGLFKCKFGTQGAGQDQMDRPSGICVTPDGHILVIDFGNHRVLAF